VTLLLLAALSLSDVRALADQHSQALAATRAEVNAARAGVDAAGQLPNPTLSVSYGADDPKLLLGLDFKLPFLGQRSAAIRSASGAAKVAGAEAEVSRLALHASVRRSFAAHWAAVEQARLAAEAARLAASLAQASQERFRTGGAPQLDVEQSALAAQKAEHDQRDKDAEAEATRRELQAIVGVPVQELSPPPQADVPPVDVLMTRLADHPELASLRFQEETARARVDQEKNAVLPLPILTVTAERFFDEQPPSWGARVGVAFDLPVLSLNRGKIQEQEETARKASLLAAAQRQHIEGQLAAARARWAAASERARFFAGPFLESASRVLDMSRAGYRIGRTALVTVLQAEADYSAARSRSVDASLEAQKALADLEEALGADL
jgi:cobalt-zinc-cadmium efflux system outer membrane protein